MFNLHARLVAAAEHAARIAAGEACPPLEISPAADEVDAIVSALNMLADELAYERKIRAHAEELLADAIDTYERAPGLFCSVDGTTLAIEKCNETLADALGLTKHQLMGKTVPALCAPDSAVRAAEMLLRLAAGGELGHGELTLKAANGQIVSVATSASRVAHAGGFRLRIVWRDVTTEMSLAAQLAQAQKMEAIGRLSGGIAHDFNNLLSVLISAAGFVREQLEAHGLPTDDLRLIEDAAARGAALTADLLAFSRQKVVEPVPTDVARVVRETERMLLRIVGEHISVASHLDSSPVTCLVDPSQLSQVLLNLAINARDAMPSGGKIEIEVRCVSLDDVDTSGRLDLEPGHYAQIEVSDTGHGMSVEVAARAFEPFFTTKPAGVGTGLGLSTCYGIIRQARGRISIYSEVGRGTTIRIFLPLVDAPVTEAAARAEVEGGSGVILLVEDDDRLRALTQRILTSAGYQVLPARSGRLALQVAAGTSERIDLVVTDVMMPEMCGPELAVELSKVRPGTRFLYVSGYTANIVVSGGILKPGISFLAKPFTPSSLLAAVRRALAPGRHEHPA